MIRFEQFLRGALDGIARANNFLGEYIDLFGTPSANQLIDQIVARGQGQFECDMNSSINETKQKKAVSKGSGRTYVCFTGQE